MNQTAVTWLINEIRKNYILKQDIFDLFEKAKQIEKQQIIDANIAGMEFIAVDSNRYCNDAEQYYKETFKQNN